MSEIKKVTPTKAPASSIPGTRKQKIVVLRIQSRVLDTGIEELEEKYSKKFGCKVVILESNLEMVDHIE